MQPHEQVYDKSVAHAIYLERFKGGLANRLIALLNRADADLVAQILAKDPTAVSGSWSQKRLEALLEEIRIINRDVHNAFGKELTKELQALAVYEAGWQVQMLTTAIPVTVNLVTPTAEQLRAAVVARPFQGRLLKEALQGLEASRAAKVRDAIRMGFVEGETISQIVQRVRGTKAAGYADGLLEIGRREAQALVRTTVAHTANVARDNTFKANSDVVDKWEFVATLDSRTSLTCASLSGKRYEIGKGPMPPRHFNCRSTALPVLKDEFAFLSEGRTRASKDGYVSGDITFSDWLKKQPASVQDDILGKTRADLFRANKITVDRFTDNKGKAYTLEQLRKKDAELFEKAGLAA